MQHSVVIQSLCAVGLLALVGCGKKNDFVAPPPPAVTIANPVQMDVTTYKRFPARVEAFESIEIRARVAGFLRSVEFEDGAMVKTGDLLFRIEPEQYQATLQTAKAQLSQAESAAKLAETTYKRKEHAFKTEAVSELDLLSAEAELDSARAAVRGAEAAVEQAELNLSYTEVRAPRDGQVGRELVNIGNLVGSGGSTLLTTLIVDNPVFAYAELDERSLLPFLKRVQLEKQNPPPVSLELANGERYSLQGKLDYMDPTLDPDTGTVTIRAVFDNPEHFLKAGMFARILVPREVKGAIVIPESAIQKDMVGAFVLLIDSQNLVEARYIKEGVRLEDGKRIVSEGLAPTDRMVVRGIQRARPGSPVSPTPVAAAPTSEKE